MKREIKADLAGWNLTARLIDPDDCWRSVCMLRSYNTSDGIATCEMGMARAALVQSLFESYPNSIIARQLTAASLRLASGYFNSSDTDETLEFYGCSLSEAAPRTIKLYREDAFPTTQLATRLAIRLGVPGVSGVEVSPLFDEVVDVFRTAMSSVRIVEN